MSTPHRPVSGASGFREGGNPQKWPAAALPPPATPAKWGFDAPPVNDYTYAAFQVALQAPDRAPARSLLADDP